MAGWASERVSCGVALLALACTACAGAPPTQSATTSGAAMVAPTSPADTVGFERPPPAPQAAPMPQEQIQVTGSRARRRVSFQSEASAEETYAAYDADVQEASGFEVNGELLRSATARGPAGGSGDDALAPDAALFAQAPGVPSARKHKSIDAGEADSAEARVATDGRAGPLLIYEATLWMAVYEVDDKQAEVIELARELGGFLSQQTGTRLVVRVPAGRFEEAIARIEKVGDIVNRDIHAEDVTDQFRDLTLRLKNAEAVRDRLAALLSKAQGVEQSLAIERELDRITERIEMLKGTLKSLSDRIAFSTITVEFGVRPQPSIDPEFNLPFRWLQTLGLDNLLSL